MLARDRDVIVSIMDRHTKDQIDNFAWDCVVGSGMGPEWAELGVEPDRDVLRALSGLLGHPLTGEEHSAFVDAWNKCLRECAHP